MVYRAGAPACPSPPEEVRGVHDAQHGQQPEADQSNTDNTSARFVSAETIDNNHPACEGEDDHTQQNDDTISSVRGIGYVVACIVIGLGPEDITDQQEERLDVLDRMATHVPWVRIRLREIKSHKVQKDAHYSRPDPRETRIPLAGAAAKGGPARRAR